MMAHLRQSFSKVFKLSLKPISYSRYTPKLLNFLSSKSLKATFFVVGSRVFYNPDILRSEYMQGHQVNRIPPPLLAISC